MALIDEISTRLRRSYAEAGQDEQDFEDCRDVSSPLDVARAGRVVEGETSASRKLCLSFGRFGSASPSSPMSQVPRPKSSQVLNLDIEGA